MNLKKGIFFKIPFIALFNILLSAILIEFLLMAMMLPLPSYFLPHHYPNENVQTTAGTISANWISNSQGFHDIEHKKGRLRNKPRIITIGDSFIEGPQQDPLPTILSRTLNGQDKLVDIVNISRVGIDTDKYELLVKYGLKRYQPNIVIVFIYEGNDFRNMEAFSTKDHHPKLHFFRRYPNPSLYGKIFPRTTIFLSDIQEGKFIHKLSKLPKHMRWGKPVAVRDLFTISEEISQFIEADPKTINAFLLERLNYKEIKELTSYGVRVDLLAYLVGVGMDVKFTKRLRLKEERPEIKSEEVAARQVNVVTNFIQEMEDNATSKGAEFYCVLIPTSNVDPIAEEMYERLNAAHDPLFYFTRRKQMADLQKRLENQSINVINLRDSLQGLENGYLKFDTHWTEKGVKTSADKIAEYLLKNSSALH